jgi:hypothetical protein
MQVMPIDRRAPLEAKAGRKRRRPAQIAPPRTAVTAEQAPQLRGGARAGEAFGSLDHRRDIVDRISRTARLGIHGLSSRLP